MARCIFNIIVGLFTIAGGAAAVWGVIRVNTVLFTLEPVVERIKEEKIGLCMV